MVMKILMMFFWVVTPCGPIGRYQCFRETYCLHLQDFSLDLPTSSHSVTTQKNTDKVIIYLNVKLNLRMSKNISIWEQH
jgi:hypothetical protein